MVRIFIVSIFFILGNQSLRAQRLSAGETVQPEFSFGMQLLGQALFTFHAEYWYYHDNRFSMNLDLGFGRAEYGDDVDTSQKPVRVIHFSNGFYFGNQWKVVCAVHPSLYFQRHYSFVNLNGMFGVRFFPVHKGPTYFMLAYTPQLYYAPTIDDYFFTSFAVAFRVGFWI
jgi:hypothetical protein